ncbi:MAG: UTRA domain-containing protein [Proteobacteria bacterium]|nr:UTRA domain-containing protein [Pseudomonadota bacterium]
MRYLAPRLAPCAEDRLALREQPSLAQYGASHPGPGRTCGLTNFSGRRHYHRARLGTLAAVAVRTDEARHLEIEAGTPLLEITRIAQDVNGRPVGLRVSPCQTAAICYAAEVT